MEPDEQTQLSDQPTKTVPQRTNAAEIRRLRQARQAAEDGPAANQGTPEAAARSPQGERKPGRPKKTATSAPLPAGFLSKKEFVLKFPATLSHAEVAEAARAEGVELSAHYVYKARAGARRKPATSNPRAAQSVPASSQKASAKTASHGETTPARAPSAAAKVAALKKTLAAKKSAAPRNTSAPTQRPTTAPRATATTFKGTKAAFIRQFDERRFTASDVVAEGRKAGVKLSVNVISAQRSSDRAKAAKTASKTATKTPRTVLSTAKPSGRAVEPSTAATPKAAAPGLAKPLAPRPVSTPLAAAQAVNHGADDDHEAFFAHVLRIGLIRAEHVLASVQDMLAELTRRR